MDYVARNSGLTDDQLQRYEVTLECRGNRDDLFAGIAFATPDGAGSSGEYQDYDIPGEALTDEKFRKMITEAEKYLGYPYVLSLIHILCELIVGGKEGLQPVEKTVIDRCVHQIYQTYFENPVPENMPVLQDLYEALLRQDDKEAHHVATALEIYVTGSLNLFNHRTNVDINNRLVCYDIQELGKQRA